MSRAAALSFVFLLAAGCGGGAAGRPRTHRDPMAGAAPTATSSGSAMATSSAVPSGMGPRWSFDGVAGGPISAMDRDPSCHGYIPASPQIHFDLPMTAAMVISASSGVDTTMVVIGPDGRIRCNDDTNGLDPQVSDTLGPGHYQVFIGTYSEGNSGTFHAEVGPG